MRISDWSSDVCSSDLWFLRYELKTIPGIAEVASIGGMVKQYQVVLQPYRMPSLGVTHADVVKAIRAANQEAGGSVIQMGEAEYMVRSSVYLSTLDDLSAIPLLVAGRGCPVPTGALPTFHIRPELTPGSPELTAQGTLTRAPV